jgi:hypothetical protein
MLIRRPEYLLEVRRGPSVRKGSRLTSIRIYEDKPNADFARLVDGRLPLLGDTERPVMSVRDGGSLARIAGSEDVPGVCLGDPAAIGRRGGRPLAKAVTV